MILWGLSVVVKTTTLLAMLSDLLRRSLGRILHPGDIKNSYLSDILFKFGVLVDFSFSVL